MLYSYTRCINGFAAVLDESQVAALNGKKLRMTMLYLFLKLQMLCFALLLLCFIQLGYKFKRISGSNRLIVSLFTKV